MIAAHSFAVVVFKQEYGAIYSHTTIVLIGFILWFIGLTASFPVNPDFNRALASSLESVLYYLGLFLLLFFIGFCINGKLSLFSVSSIFYVAAIFSVFCTAMFFGVKRRVW